MAGASLGSLVVSLALDAVDYISGLSKAEQAAQKLEQQTARMARGIDKQVKALQDQANLLGKSAREAKLYELAQQGATKAQLASANAALRQAEAYALGEKIGNGLKVGIVALAAAALGTAAAFDRLVKGAANFKDIEEQTGGSAEGFASLTLAAAGAGVQMESISSASVRLTKGLTGVDDESKAVGAALTALGLPIEAFRKLDPVAQYEAVGKALGGFADGAKKTQVAVALFGKSGAEQLKVFKQLEEQGGRQVLLTQSQIEQADAYADAQAVATAKLKAYAQVAATQALPALGDLTEVVTTMIREFGGVGTESNNLAGNTGVVDFAEKGADALARLIDLGSGTSKVFRRAGTQFGSLVAEIDALRRGDLAGAKSIVAATREELARINQDEESAFDRLQKQRAKRKAGLTGARLDAQTDPRSLTFGKGKPALDFDGAATGSKDKAQSEAARYLETLQKQGEKTQQLTVYEAALAEIQAKRLKGLTPQLEQAILAQARENDARAYAAKLIEGEIKAREGVTKVIEAANKAATEETARLAEGNEALRQEIEIMGASESARAAIENARLQSIITLKQEQLMMLKNADAIGVQTQELENQIRVLEERQRLNQGKADVATFQALATDAKKTGAEVRDTLGDSIEQGLVDGFRRGGSLADIFVNELKAQFARTVLRPLIQPVVDGGNQLIGSLLGQLGGLFKGTPDYTSGGTFAGPDGISPLATGTNYIPQDGLHYLHKGEAVVPKAYNPDASAGARKAGSGGAVGGVQIINNGPPMTARQEQERQPDGTVLTKVIMDLLESDAASGGRYSATLQRTFGLKRSNARR